MVRANSGTNVVVIGNGNATNNTAALSVIIGNNSGTNVSGTSNDLVIIGDTAGINMANVYDIVAIGKQAGYGNSGAEVTALGSSAGYGNSGSEVVAMGLNAGKNNTSKFSNLIGDNAGIGAAGGLLYLDCVGYNSCGTINSTSSFIVGIGAYASGDNTGGDIVGIGDSSGTDHSGNNIVAIGNGAGVGLSISSTPTPSTGNNIVAIGNRAGNGSGSEIIALGTAAVQGGTASYPSGNQGNNIIGIGNHALTANLTGINNIAIGDYAGADGWLSVGSLGNSNTAGSNNVWIGNDAGPFTPTQLSNTIALGYQAHNTQSNQTIIGNSSVTQTIIYGIGNGCLTIASNIVTGTGSNCFSGAFSSLTGGTISSAALVIGAGSSLSTTGGGVIAATSAVSLTSLTGLPAIAANTILGNNTSGAISPVAMAIPPCNSSASALIWTNGIGFGCNTLPVNTATDYYWSNSGNSTCQIGIGQPNHCDYYTQLPGIMPDANYELFCTINMVGDGPAAACNISQTPLPTTAGGSILVRIGQYQQDGTTGTTYPTVYFHAHHN